MPKRVQKPSGIKPITPSDVNIHMLLYGDPGSEKTRTAGTSPRALILNFDGSSGTDSIVSLGNKVHTKECEDLDDAEDVYEYLKHTKSHPYKWVWIDSLTLAQEKETDKVMRNLVAAKPHRDPDVPDMHEYLQVQNRIKKLVRKFIGLDDINVGITAHRMRIEDDDDGSVAYWPAITGKLMPQKICGYMGIVGYMETVTKKTKGDKTKEVTRLRATKTEKIYAKDRYGALGIGMESPTVPKIMDKVQNALSGSEE